MAVDLRHLRAFVAVAEDGNIGRAAERLFITQPALSRQIQQLEREIGARLLERTPRGVELTDPGRELLVKARVAVEAADDALGLAHPDAPHGKVVIGLPLAGGRDRWYALVQAFLARYPEVEADAIEGISEHLQRQVLAGDVDVTIAVAPAHLPSLVYTHVLDETLSVWMHREHPFAARSQLGLDDLGGHPIALIRAVAGQVNGYNVAIRNLFSGAGVEPRFVETTELNPARAVVNGHLGISPPLEYGPDVVSRPLVPHRTLAFAVVHRDDAGSAARAFAPFAEGFLGRHAPAA